MHVPTDHQNQPATLTAQIVAATSELRSDGGIEIDGQSLSCSEAAAVVEEFVAALVLRASV